MIGAGLNAPSAVSSKIQLQIRQSCRRARGLAATAGHHPPHAFGAHRDTGSLSGSLAVASCWNRDSETGRRLRHSAPAPPDRVVPEPAKKSSTMSPGRVAWPATPLLATAVWDKETPCCQRHFHFIGGHAATGAAQLQQFVPLINAIFFIQPGNPATPGARRSSSGLAVQCSLRGGRRCNRHPVIQKSRSGKPSRLSRAFFFGNVGLPALIGGQQFQPCC